MSVQTSSPRSGPAGDFAALLLGWYEGAARDLPWRLPPASTAAPDPYRVWLSEVMLQQTTVAAVAGYFERFTKRWPTLADLAAAHDADVMAAWAGLGYYARARNLLACARTLVRDHGGNFPDTEEGLRELPGVGDYTAAAIAAIAFNRPAIVVDANIERVIARHHAITAPLPGARRAIRAALAPLVPAKRPGDFAQALMDLGSRICTPRAPRCSECPVADGCKARADGIAERLPVKPARRAKPMKHGLAHWIERDGKLWLVRRPGKGMLGGMRSLPGSSWGEEVSAEAALTEVRHVFTHFELTLRLVAREAPDSAAEGEWWPLSALDAAGLPTLYRKLVSKMRETRE